MEVAERAVVRAHHQIQQAVAIQVDQRRRAQAAGIDASDGAGRAGDEGGHGWRVAHERCRQPGAVPAEFAVVADHDVVAGARRCRRGRARHEHRRRVGRRVARARRVDHHQRVAIHDRHVVVGRHRIDRRCQARRNVRQGVAHHRHVADGCRDTARHHQVQRPGVARHHRAGQQRARARRHRRHRVGAHAGQYDVAAVAGDDRVAPRRLVNHVDGPCRIYLHRARPEIDLRVVADDQVVAANADDIVRAGPADHDVVATETEYRVVAADSRIDAEYHVGIAEETIGDIARAATAQLLDDRRGRNAAHVIKAHHAAAVAEEDVVGGATGDAVIALAAKHDQLQRRGVRGGGQRVRAGTQHGVVVGNRRVVVPRPLRVQHEDAVRRVGAVGLRRLEIHINRVVAQAGIERRNGPHAGTILRAVDPDGIGAEAGPDRYAVAEVACRSLVADRALLPVDPAEGVVAAGKPANRDLGADRLGNQGKVGDHDVAVVERARFTADHQQVAARPGIDVQRAVDVVQVAEQEVCRGTETDVRGGRHIDAVAAAARVDAGRRRRALDIEHVGARAKGNGQVFDFVVIDAFHPRRDDGGAGFDVIRARYAIDCKGRGKDVAGDVLDAEHIALTGCAEFRPAQEVDPVGELAGDRGQGVARDGAYRGVESGERVDLERQGGSHLFQRRDRHGIHAFAISHGNGIGSVQRNGPGLARDRRAAERRAEERRRHREAAQVRRIAGHRHFAGRIHQHSGHRHDVDRIQGRSHRHRGGEGRTGQRDGPVLRRGRLAGGQDARRRREQLAVAANDQDDVVLGDRREVGVGPGVDRRCQTGRDGLQGVGGTNRDAMDGRRRRAVAQGERPHLTRHRLAREVQRRFGRRRTVDGRYADTRRADG